MGVPTVCYPADSAPDLSPKVGDRLSSCSPHGCNTCGDCHCESDGTLVSFTVVMMVQL